MARWTKKAAVQRARESERLNHILEVEPRLQAIIDTAIGLRKYGGYDRIRTYIHLRNQAIPLVGWFADKQELRTAEDYTEVIQTIADLLPHDEADLIKKEPFYGYIGYGQPSLPTKES